MRLAIASLVGALSSAIVPTTATAHPTASGSTILDTARVVELRASCAMPNGAYLDNCFETTGELTDWLWDDAGTPAGRASEPNSLDPVTVRVGPGRFDPFRCATTPGVPRGFVSVLGAGRDVTHFVGTATLVDPTTSVCEGGISSLYCTSLGFSDVTASGPGTGVYWLGAGDSFWESVDMEVDNGDTVDCTARAYAWYDKFGERTETSPAGVHFFWNSRMEARGVGGAVAAFYSHSQSWFYGADFVMRVVSGSPGTYGGVVTVVRATTATWPERDGVHIFGSTVRGIGEAAFSGNLTGLRSVGSGTLHMHGGIVNVNASGSASGVAVGAATDHQTGFIHALQTAFVIKGTIKIRIYGPGTIQWPFFWPRGTTQPDVLSFTGADFFVKTDEGPGQDEARLFVYDESCSATWTDRWRNVTTGNCI